MKTCSKCKQTKPLSDFGVDNRRKDKLSWQCKQCHRDEHRFQKYGITAEEYYELRDYLGGCCAICGMPETGMRKGELIELAVDHNHETGRVRLLLCRNCNIGLGYFKDNTLYLQRAIDYLNACKEANA